MGGGLYGLSNGGLGSGGSEGLGGGSGGEGEGQGGGGGAGGGGGGVSGGGGGHCDQSPVHAIGMCETSNPCDAAMKASVIAPPEASRSPICNARKPAGGTVVSGTATIRAGPWERTFPTSVLPPRSISNIASRSHCFR